MIHSQLHTPFTAQRFMETLVNVTADNFTEFRRLPLTLPRRSRGEPTSNDGFQSSELFYCRSSVSGFASDPPGICGDTPPGIPQPESQTPTPLQQDGTKAQAQFQRCAGIRRVTVSRSKLSALINLCLVFQTSLFVNLARASRLAPFLSEVR